MPQGFQVFNADGSLQFDSSMRLMRTIAAIATNGTSGSQTIPGLSTAGTPVPVILGTINPTGSDCPAVTISGNTVSWTYGAGNGSAPNIIIAVMVR